MCELCEGTGGVNIIHSWGVEYLPCNHPKCDYDRKKDIQESEAIINKLKSEIYSREEATC